MTEQERIATFTSDTIEQAIGPHAQPGATIRVSLIIRDRLNHIEEIAGMKIVLDTTLRDGVFCLDDLHWSLYCPTKRRSGVISHS